MKLQQRLELKESEKTLEKCVGNKKYIQFIDECLEAGLSIHEYYIKINQILLFGFGYAWNGPCLEKRTKGLLNIKI